MKRILRNTFTVGGLTAVSRVLGLVREMLQSRLIGAGVEQSAFTLAFAIPNMARKLFGEGALTAAFVPVFKGEVERGDVEEARRLAREWKPAVVVNESVWTHGAFRGLGIPQVLDAHDVNLHAVSERFGRKHPYTRLVKAVEGRAARESERICCCSEVDAEGFAREYGVPEGKLRVDRKSVV